MEPLPQLTELTELDKAWHLLSLLLPIGHPVPVPELASRCTLFDSSPEFVEHLCSLPDSPIMLSEGKLLATLSRTVYQSFEKFVISMFVPRMSAGVLLELRRVWGDMYLQNVDEMNGCNGNQSNYAAEVQFQVDMNRNTIKNTENSDESNKMMLLTSSFIESRGRLLSYGLDNSGVKSLDCASTSKCQYSVLNQEKLSHVPDEKPVEKMESDMPEGELFHLPSKVENSFFLEEAETNKPYSLCELILNDPYCPDVDEQMMILPVDPDNTLYMGICKSDERVVGGGEEEERRNYGGCEEDAGDPLINTTNTTMTHDDDFRRNITLGRNVMSCSADRKRRTTIVESQTILPAELLSIDKKQPSESLSQLRIIQKDVENTGLQVVQDCEAFENYMASGALEKQQQSEIDKKPILVKQKLKQNDERCKRTDDRGDNLKEIRENPVSANHKDQDETKLLPDLKSFTVEEEEGSGGYGTVYRAKRKRDGVTLAIKCPHDNANKNHIQNEMKMLKRFGGKNFVIKYEGSFKHGSADCLVLEHVEHDRPEVLKKEIDVPQLQWYGYCLFRALAGLHKQGVMHRDVKPGNFLFSRKLNKGYLIDFNLAMDLHQKYGNTDKSATSYEKGFNHVPLPYAKSLPPVKSRKFATSKALDTTNQESGRLSKSLSLPKNLKKKTNQAKEDNKLSIRNLIQSQGADGSGITSARDGTSTKIPSAERLREPMPCQGRKELLSLAQEAMKGPNHEVARSPASKRKRIAAFPEKVNRKLVYLTPMPLHSAGVAVAGSGLMKSKGESKHKREGPCVGTKGFRAPEVLLRSICQGPKVDIWSAGVTLLYLMTGRSPFIGDPDQNIKDIAKFRGSEDLWELAKLHNRESSFPVELFEKQHLASKKLRDWCALNTRRPAFLEIVPTSLFDLLDKCLTVNPRLRISAEEALGHEFFATCYERLRKKRLLRQDLTHSTTLPLNSQMPCL